MSGFERKIMRAGLRAQYEQFSKAFRQEKYYQQLILDADPAVQEAIKAGKNSVEEETKALDGKPKLGRKPPFGTWIKAMESARTMIMADALKKMKEQDAPTAATEGTEVWAEEPAEAADVPAPRLELKLDQ